MMSDTNEDPNEETIKCVVVGDNNTGKTRLICSRAYKETSPNYRCISNACHIPTVWAIDQYRMNNQVLQNARCNIDGVDVSLRLWDTFGDHHKNRKYALGKADVVIICFSVSDRNSLAHVSNFWEPEVRKHCRNVPIILVACKIDLRFVELVKANRAKGIYMRPVKYNELLYPEECSLQAKSLGCLFYETSVFLGHGVNQVFDNACRAALFHRRSVSVWTNSALKKVKRPEIQKPLEPPKPRQVEIVEFEQKRPPLHNLVSIFQHGSLSDVKFICQGEIVKSHRAILAASSEVFHDLLSTTTTRVGVMSSHQRCVITIPPYDVTNNDDVITYEITRTSDETDEVTTTLTTNIDADTMRSLLLLCYTSSTSSSLRHHHHGNRHLVALARSLLLDISDDCCGGNPHHRKKIGQLLFDRKLFCDVSFIVDDGNVAAHKMMLAAGSDVMNAMFCGNFIESSTDEVKMPGTTCASLNSLIEFVYTGQLSHPIDSRLSLVGDLLCLANRLCLPHLVYIIESQVIAKFEDLENEYNNSNNRNKLSAHFLEDVVCMLDLAKFHNACNLAKWCLRFLCVHYNQACWTVPKLIKAQPLAVQHFIEENRWPPVWYIKQKDVYDKALHMLKKSECSPTAGAGGLQLRKSKK